MKLPAQGRTPSQTSPAAPRTRRRSMSEPSNFMVRWTSSVDTRLYPSASPRELAEFQVFAEAVSARREDGRGSEDRGEDSREDTGDDRRWGAGTASKGQRGGGTAWIDQGAPGPLRRALGAKASWEHQVRPLQGRASPAREGFPRA